MSVPSTTPHQLWSTLCECTWPSTTMNRSPCAYCCRALSVSVRGKTPLLWSTLRDCTWAAPQSWLLLPCSRQQQRSQHRGLPRQRWQRQHRQKLPLLTTTTVAEEVAPTTCASLYAPSRLSGWPRQQGRSAASSAQRAVTMLSGLVGLIVDDAAALQSKRRGRDLVDRWERHHEDRRERRQGTIKDVTMRPIEDVVPNTADMDHSGPHVKR